MNMDVTQLPCSRCGKPKAEWTEGDGGGIARGEATYCSEACAEQDVRPESLEQGPGSIAGAPAAGPAAGPEAAGSPAAAPSPADLTGPRTGGLRPESGGREGPAEGRGT